jgi:hypothetical protein
MTTATAAPTKKAEVLLSPEPRVLMTLLYKERAVARKRVLAHEILHEAMLSLKSFNACRMWKLFGGTKDVSLSDCQLLRDNIEIQPAAPECKEEEDAFVEVFHIANKFGVATQDVVFR